MSLLELYAKQHTLGPDGQQTYEQTVFQMERAGVNDLVERNMIDPTFRPPLPEDSYISTLFEDTVQ